MGTDRQSARSAAMVDGIIGSSQPTAPTYVPSPDFLTGVDGTSTQLPR